MPIHTQYPSLQYSNSLFKQNSLKVAILAKTKGWQEDGWSGHVSSPKLGCLILFYVWYPSFNPIPLKEPFL